MALWKDPSPAKRESGIATADPLPKVDTPPRPEPSMSHDNQPRRVVDREAKESVIASDLTVEGKIEGSGHVRIAGRFKGDVNVQGHVTIEAGAKLTGSVRANTVIIGGEL